MVGFFWMNGRLMNEMIQLSRAAFRRSFGLENTPPITPSDSWFDAARRHRMIGLWTDAFDSLPSRWKTAAYGQALFTARLSDEAARIADALSGSVEGLRVVKGPALEKQAWPRLGLRSFDDLDFRCKKDALPALVDGLSALGYQVKAQDDHHRDNLWHFGWGLEFRHPTGLMIEVNHRMFPPHFPWPERLTRQNSEQWAFVELNGTPVCCPVPSLHLLLVCAHAAWHGWERLAWIVDMAGLLIRHPGVFPQAQSLVGGSTFLNNTLECGCRIASEIFGPLPGIGLSGADPLTAQAIKRLVRDKPDVPLQTQREIHHHLMSLPERAVYTARRLATPGDPDFISWPLPPCLNGLYWITRPVRGLLKGLKRIER